MAIFKVGGAFFSHPNKLNPIAPNPFTKLSPEIKKSIGDSRLKYDPNFFEGLQFRHLMDLCEKKGFSKQEASSQSTLFMSWGIEKAATALSYTYRCKEANISTKRALKYADKLMQWGVDDRETALNAVLNFKEAGLTTKEVRKRTQQIMNWGLKDKTNIIFQLSRFDESGIEFEAGLNLAINLLKEGFANDKITAIRRVLELNQNNVQPERFFQLARQYKQEKGLTSDKEAFALVFKDAKNGKFNQSVR